MVKPAIVCAVRPSPAVRTLLEVYYRFMDYRILYVCPKGDALSWIADGTHLPPGTWYSTDDEVPATPGPFTFAIVDNAYTALCWQIRGVTTFELGDA